MKHTTVRLPEKKLQDAKIQAARLSTSLQALLVRGLDLAIAERKQEEKRA